MPFGKAAELFIGITAVLAWSSDKLAPLFTITRVVLAPTSNTVCETVPECSSLSFPEALFENLPSLYFAPKT